jgi:hypothetical protein
MDKPGVYRLRILPVAPNPDGTLNRKSYEFPTRQITPDIEKPDREAGKPVVMYITVPRATDAGYTGDIIDIYRYSRYQAEATIEFLKQCDTKYGLKIMETKEVRDAVVQLLSELPKEDKTSFSFEKRTKERKENTTAGEISLDTLLNRFDELNERGLDDKTEEGQELRSLIRTFIEQERLPVRITRSTSNREILDEIEKMREEENESDDLPF